MTIITAIKHLSRRQNRLNRRIEEAKLKGHKLPQWDVSEKKAIEVAIICMMKERTCKRYES